MDETLTLAEDDDSLAGNTTSSTTGASGKSILSLTWDDLEVGRLIGSGSFACVYQMKPLNPALLSQSEDLDEDQYYENAEFSSHMFCSERSLPTHGDQRFALKTLNQELLDKESSSADAKAKCAILGIQFEADLLAKLPRHEHLVTLFGFSPISVQEPTQGFLVLERLTETLDERLKRWKNRKMIERNGKSLLDRMARKGDPEQRNRITHVGLGIAKAMSFLHNHKVLYRDLKPDNIGFDIREGKVKLFDFGCARRLENRNDDGKNLTFQVGSFRYMSPECAKGEDYSFSTDVYSFAILLWELITLETAFSKASNVQQLSKMAFFGHQRPPLKLVESREIRKLLKASWDPNPELRPSFAPIISCLRLHAKDDKNQARR